MSLEHILLGMLREKRASGYELKKAFNEGARHFWFAELSQIYPTLKSLEQQGYLASSLGDSQRGPKRRLYRVTRKGLSKLKKWLTSDPKVGHDRFPYIARIFFLHELEDLDVTWMQVERLRRDWTEKLEALERLEPPELCDSESNEFHRYAALRAGVHQLRGKLAWCEETIQAIDARRRSNGND